MQAHWELGVYVLARFVCNKGVRYCRKGMGDEAKKEHITYLLYLEFCGMKDICPKVPR